MAVLTAMTSAWHAPSSSGSVFLPVAKIATTANVPMIAMTTSKSIAVKLRCPAGSSVERSMLLGSLLFDIMGKAGGGVRILAGEFDSRGGTDRRCAVPTVGQLDGPWIGP